MKTMIDITPLKTSGQESCGSCKFFRRHADRKSEGQCRRFPPVVIVAPVKTKMGNIEPHPVSITANMEQDDWCGEYKMRVTIQ